MTLHLTGISKRYALQVSDRLVSGGMNDPLANKNIIYCCRDAVVSMGYTGFAYGLSESNENTPTDEWLAEVLWREPIPRGRDGIRPVMMCNRANASFLDIGQSAELLRKALEVSLKRVRKSKWQGHPFQLVMSGWQETRRKGLRPVVIELLEEGDPPIVIIKRRQRYWYVGGKIEFIATPRSYLPQSERSGIVGKLATANAEQAEHALLTAIREVASRHSGKVGRDCMSILIFPPTGGRIPIRVRFIPEAPQIGTLVSETKKTKTPVPIAFSPWVVTPGSLSAASILGGQATQEMGPLQIFLDGPTPPAGLVGYASSLERPKWRL